jgi:hypothetical protein
MDPNDLDLYVICETTGQLVLACHCGPHEACPEHPLNCLMKHRRRQRRPDQRVV